MNKINPEFSSRAASAILEKNINPNHLLKDTNDKSLLLKLLGRFNPQTNEEIESILHEFLVTPLDEFSKKYSLDNYESVITNDADGERKMAA